MGNYYSAGILRFIQTLFEIYTAALLVRFLLDWFSGKLFNPVYRFIYSVTQAPIGMLQKVLPNRRGFNWATLGLIIVLELIKLIILVYVTTQQFPGIIGLLIWGFADLLSLAKVIFFWSIIIYAILSWVSMINHSVNPLQEITAILVAPLLRPVQRVLPTIGGMDLSPLVVFFGLQVFSFFVIMPLLSLGQGLAL